MRVGQRRRSLPAPHPSTPAPAPDPVVPVLVLAGLTQVWRQAWVDVAVFVGAAVIIAWDRRRWPPVMPVRRPRRLGALRQGLVCLAALAAGAVLAVPDRSGPVLSAALAVPGAAAGWLALRRPAPSPVLAGTRSGVPAAGAVAPPPPVGRGWVVWVVLAVLLALVELSSFLSQADPRVDNPDRPTLSTIVEPWLAGGAARAVGIAGWLCCGWWLVRRIRASMRAV